MHSVKDSHKSVDIIAYLPVEVVETIVDFLDLDDHLRCCCVSKTWNRIVSSLSIWKRHFLNISICKREPCSSTMDWKVAYIRARQLETALLSSSHFRTVTFTLKKRQQATCLGRVHQKLAIGSLKSVEYDSGHLLVVSEMGYVWLWSDMDTTSMNAEAVWRLREDSVVSEARFSISKCTVVFLLSNSHIVITNLQGVRRIAWNCAHGNNHVKTIGYSAEIDTLVTVEGIEVRVWKILEKRLNQMITFLYGLRNPFRQRCSVVAHWKEGRHLIILNPQFWIPELIDTDDGYGLSIVRNTNVHDYLLPSYVSSYCIQKRLLYLHSIAHNKVFVRDLDRDETIKWYETDYKRILAIGDKMLVSYGRQNLTQVYKNEPLREFNLSVGCKRYNILEKGRKRTVCCPKWLDGFTYSGVVGEWKQQLISAHIRKQQLELVWFIPPDS